MKLPVQCFFNHKKTPEQLIVQAFFKLSNIQSFLFQNCQRIRGNHKFFVGRNYAYFYA